MAISFADSLAANIKPSEPISGNYTDRSALVYSLEDWTLDNRYKFYPEYSDESISTVDALKNIVLSQTQINLTQETNSQFIPFQMPRYYDGFDLLTTEIQIYFVNKNGFDSYSAPINLYYNDTSIKFGWLVNKHATATDGQLWFEIQALGTNSLGDKYLWKTRPCGDVNIMRSLSGKASIQPDENWLSAFSLRIEEKLDEKLLNYYTRDDVDLLISELGTSSDISSKEEIVEEVLSALPTWTGGSY